MSLIEFRELNRTDVSILGDYLDAEYLRNSNSKLYLGLVNNEYRYIFEAVNVFDAVMVYPQFIFHEQANDYDSLIDIVKVASKIIKNSIFYFASSEFRMLPASFKEIQRADRKLGFNEINLSEDGYYLTEYSPTLLIDGMARSLFVDKVEEDKIQFVTIGQQDLEGMMNHFNKMTNHVCSMEWTKVGGCKSIYGFKYFRKFNRDNDAARWLLAVQDGKILGAIGYTEFDWEYFIAYVDIAKPYEEKGLKIAELLVQELSTQLKDWFVVKIGIGAEYNGELSFRKYIRNRII